MKTTRAELEQMRKLLADLREKAALSEQFFETAIPLLTEVDKAINDAEFYISGTGEPSDGSWKVNIPDMTEVCIKSCFKYDWSKEELPNSELVTVEFMQKTIEVAGKLGVSPDDLMAIMAYESRFNPQQGEGNEAKAAGLIQFTQDAIDEINNNNGTEYTKADLWEMSGVEQLDIVYLHYEQFKGRMKDLGDIYLVTLAPAFVDGKGRSGDTIIYSREETPRNYSSNSGLDKENKGYITKDDALAAVLNRREEYLY